MRMRKPSSQMLQRERSKLQNVVSTTHVRDLSSKMLQMASKTTSTKKRGKKEKTALVFLWFRISDILKRETLMSGPYSAADVPAVERTVCPYKQR